MAHVDFFWPCIVSSFVDEGGFGFSFWCGTVLAISICSFAECVCDAAYSWVFFEVIGDLSKTRRAVFTVSVTVCIDDSVFVFANGELHRIGICCGGAGFV